MKLGKGNWRHTRLKWKGIIRSVIQRDGLKNGWKTQGSCGIKVLRLYLTYLIYLISPDICAIFLHDGQESVLFKKYICKSQVRHDLSKLDFMFWQRGLQFQLIRIIHAPIFSMIDIPCDALYSSVLSCQAFDLEWGWKWPCCDGDQYQVSMMTKSFAFEKQQRLYHNKLRSPLASLPFRGLATKYETVKWTIRVD